MPWVRDLTGLRRGCIFRTVGAVCKRVFALPESVPDRLPTQTLLVYAAADFRVVAGANLGDPLGDADDLVHDDVYACRPDARRLPLTFQADPSGYTIANTSETGCAGARLHLDSVATFMAPTGQMVEVLILAEVDGAELAAIYFLPFDDIPAKMDFALVGVDRSAAQGRFAELACVSFSAGTSITLSTGLQTPVEALSVGDLVLTRSSGAQPIRWIGHQTTRAVGTFAPICIRAGVLNNARDLIVSPNHRLFVYQRRDELAVGRSEIMVKAADLVNGVDVIRTDGGFIEYYQLLFDQHEIIYAEGIAAESMLVDARSEPHVPAAVREKIAPHRSEKYLRLEVDADKLDPAVADRLRKASLG